MPAGTGVPVFLGGEWPAGCAPISASSGNVGNASAIATLAAAVGVTTYLAGFLITAAGSTLGLAVTGTVVGLVGGTMSFVFTALVGALLASPPLFLDFHRALPASATNTAIVVTLPALGLGNTNACVSAWGYQL